MSRTYRKLYRMFAHTTPLKTDCGRICGGACCRGDAKTGMLLFPGEPTVLPTVRANDKRYVLCGGTCSRKERPLSCRIFPFFPVQDETGRTEARIDLRGEALCPLVRQSENVLFSRRFLKRVSKTGKILMQNDDCAAFMREIWEEIVEIGSLRSMLTGNNSDKGKEEE